MEPLTPNTAAILEYIAANYDPSTDASVDFGQADGNIMGFGQGQAQPVSNLPFSAGPNFGLKGIPDSLPPSAFNMPVPGRDTPEATPESSNGGTDNSPVEGNNGKGAAGAGADAGAGSDSDALVDVHDAGARRKSTAGQGSGAQNKRKAGHTHRVEHISDEEDDSESDDPAGHEDKRPHPNDRLSPLAGSGKKGPRKSKGGDEGGTPKLTKETKAARRKEQNRAAQKAFRERREAKVKDLEDHIAELEAKNKGQSSENENLRNLLRTLQDENVRLKQSAFTFHVPVSGTSTPQSTNNAGNGNGKGSGHGNGAKALSPPEQEVLRSVHDLTPPLSRSTTRATSLNNNTAGAGNVQTQHQAQAPPTFLQHRSSTGSSAGAPADSPQSMTSGTTASTSSIPSAQAHPSFDTADMFNAFASGVRPEWLKKPFAQQGQQQGQQGQQQQQPSRQTSTSGSIPSLSPSGVEGSNNADLQALWASFFPQSANGNVGANGSTFTQPQQLHNTGAAIANGAQGQGQFSNLGNADMSPFNLFATNGNGNVNLVSNNDQISDKMAFRDSSFANTSFDNQNANQNGNQGQNQSQNQSQSQFKTGLTPGAQPQSQPQPQVYDWTNNGYSDDTGVNDFLASLIGNGNGGGYNNSFEPQDISAEDEFTAQLQKLLDQSGSGAAAALNSPDQLFGMPGQVNGGAGDVGNNWANFGMGNGMGMGVNMGTGMGMGMGMGTNGNSPSNSTGNGSNNGWSPSNYLNMSPFASSGSASASDSPSSNLRESSASLSNSASPEPSTGLGMGMGSGPQGGHMAMPKGGVNAALSPAGSNSNGNKAATPNHTVVQVPSADPAGSKRAVQDVFAAAKRGDVVHVVGEDGKILKPSDVWVRMGMHQSNQVDNLLIDDLCDQMKQKATCQDGSYRLSVKDAERMFKYKGQPEEAANAACPFNKSA